VSRGLLSYRGFCVRGPQRPSITWPCSSSSTRGLWFSPELTIDTATARFLGASRTVTEPESVASR